VLESIQRVHAFGRTTCTFFIPAFSTGLWFDTIEKLLPQSLHVIAALYLCKIGCEQTEFLPRVI
jgi:hypothetical protein